MKILLINSCPPKDLTHLFFPALGIGYLASTLEQSGYDVDLLDLNLVERPKISDVLREIDKHQYDFLGVSAGQFTSWAAQAIGQAMKTKNRKVFLCLGGSLPTLAPETVLVHLDYYDCFVLGEGELTLLELISCLQAGKDWKVIKSIAYINGSSIVKNPLRPPIRDIDTIPHPKRTYMSTSILHQSPHKRLRDHTTMIGSRGCYGCCSFCALPSFYRQHSPPFWRPRHPNEIVKEMAWLQQKRGIRYINFYDDDFIGGKGGKYQKRIQDIAAKIIDNNLDVRFSFFTQAQNIQAESISLLQKAGLRRVFIGFENFDDNVLSCLKKTSTVKDNLRALDVLSGHNVCCEPGLILYAPDIPFESIHHNLQFLQENAHKLLTRHDILFWSVEFYYGSKLFSDYGGNEQTELDRKACRAAYHDEKMKLVLLYTEAFRKAVYHDKAIWESLPFKSDRYWFDCLPSDLDSNIRSSFEYIFLLLSIEYMEKAIDNINTGRITANHIGVLADTFAKEVIVARDRFLKTS